MAGSNLSARQKMINMMYLVLTALLALNVSAEILDAFASLRTSIKSSAETVAESNRQTGMAIKDKVQEEIDGGNSKNAYVVGLLGDIETKTKSVLSYLDGVTKELEEIAEYDPKTGEYEKNKEMELNYQFWMGAGKEQKNNGRGDGEAIKLRETLNGYVDWARQFILDNDSILKANPDSVDEVYNLNPIANDEKDGEKWEYHTFHSKPVVADLAMMEKFKLDIQERQSELLTFLKAKLGAVVFKIDTLIAVDAPTSQVVVAGATFETRLFVIPASKSFSPEFSGSGRVTNPTGDQPFHKMEIVAPSSFSGYETEVSYSASAKVLQADGTEKKLPISGKFKVRKPEVVITSAAVQNLYRQCGNEVNIDVPALGDQYDPRISASDADVRGSSSNKKKFMIIPRGQKCVVSVASMINGKQVKIDDVVYKVIEPPKPTINLLVNGKTHDGLTPIPMKSNCKVIISADPEFKSALPRDARYYPGSITLKVQNSLGAPRPAGQARGGEISLASSLRGKARPGTKIFFEINGVFRKNYEDKDIPVRLSKRELILGATVK